MLTLTHQPVATNATVKFNPAHILAMTDATGIIQHSYYSIPDRRHGYALDDNVRALIAVAQSQDPALLALLPVYLSFVRHCQQPDGSYLNFMGYDRRFLEAGGSPDSQGRTLWALGTLFLKKPAYRAMLAPMLGAFYKHLAEISSPRALAFAILGLYPCIVAQPNYAKAKTTLTELADRLVESWEQNQHPGWQWFEKYLTYENARFPQALFAAYLVTKNALYLKVACKAADFLEKVHFEKNYLKLIGNAGWLKQGQAIAEFDEQPVDAGALVEMYHLAHQATGETRYLDLAHRAFSWYSGNNCHGIALYNPLTGGCYDGLVSNGVNYNQGAESVLSYLLAWQSLQKKEFSSNGTNGTV
jgi:Beta-L-arabinofuranosidase, GH127